MASHDFLPTLTEYDIQRAAELVLQAYSPSMSINAERLKVLQQDLFEIQKRPEAWGLVIPLLNHQDQNVQFFGAHTAQVKIVRDWDSFPKEHAELLRDMLIQLTTHSIAVGRNKVILRKLFVALTSMALKLVPGHPSQWPNWILSCVSAFSSQGASTEYAHDFLAIVAEEVSNADLFGSGRIQMQQSMTDATPITVQSVTSIISQPLSAFSTTQYLAALKCLQAWMPFLRGDDLTSLIPLLIALLDLTFPEDLFAAASEVLQELTSKSALADAGSKTLTEPLLVWLDIVGNGILESTYATAAVSPVSHSLCKLLVALGDHSATYLASNIASSITVSTGPSTTPMTRGHLVQNFLRLLLAYTGLPGFYGIDEEESEMTLGFWYLFQEALWTVDFYAENGDADHTPPPQGPDSSGDQKQLLIAKAVYMELINVLRRKAAFPPPGSGWSRDQVDKYQVYRRDIGDTLINAYYVLRADMLDYFITEIEERLPQTHNGWQEVEASLHCIMSVQEAVDLEKSPQLRRLFSPQIFGRLPSTGRSRIRRTALGVVGTYSSWFAIQSLHTPPSNLADEPNLLLTALSFVVSALSDPSLCQSAATALKKLCDANRKELAIHINAFGELHSSLNAIPDSEKSKVLQSIASVIQAMPVEQEIPAVEAIINPINENLYTALRTASNSPDESRSATTLYLETLAGVAKGLTRTNVMTVLEDETDPLYEAEVDKIKQAREDVRIVHLRNNIFSVVKGVVELWSADAAVAQTLSDLVKAITSLPSDVTLITLPAGPLLELVCLAIQEQLTATWLSLASILIAQLNPPVFSLNLKSGPTPEAETTIRRLLPVLLQCSLTYLRVDNAMESNPDIVQEFFGCMDRIAQDLTGSFYSLSQDLLDALLYCAIKSLSLQERYSLVSACTFLSNLINRSSLTDELIIQRNQLLSRHGRSIMRAVLEGFAGVAPRSVVQNLIELLGTLLNRASGAESGLDGGAQQWIKDVLLSDDFFPSKATPEAKGKFLKAITGSRFSKKIRDAAQQFTLMARGLEGSNFGYSSMTM